MKRDLLALRRERARGKAEQRKAFIALKLPTISNIHSQRRTLKAADGRLLLFLKGPTDSLIRTAATMTWLIRTFSTLTGQIR